MGKGVVYLVALVLFIVAIGTLIIHNFYPGFGKIIEDNTVLSKIAAAFGKEAPDVEPEDSSSSETIEEELPESTPVPEGSAPDEPEMNNAAPTQEKATNSGSGGGSSVTSAESQETTCGNVLEDGEACDDGNSLDGDGCSADCSAIETNYTCENTIGQPSECVVENVGGPTSGLCGDGSITDAEQCDDGNEMSRDGCVLCEIETGYDCDGAPSICTTICGDGYLAREEFCDDSNTASGDGCSSSCNVEDGYSCSGSPGECFPICGDSIVIKPEECDDGNTADGDGCSSSCIQESCPPPPEEGSPSGAVLLDSCESSYDARIIIVILLMIVFAYFVYTRIRKK